MASMVLASCAGLKPKDRPPYDVMDNLTSRYNIIHHSREMVAKAEQDNLQSHRENYRYLLPVFVEPTEVSASAHTILMDSVINKARRVINEKNKGKYIHEAYFLTGKANYLKGNYYNAAAFFEYVADVTADSPKLRQQALIWQARALMQLETTRPVGELLDSVLDGLDRHKRSRALAHASRARYHLLRDEEKQAINALTTALQHRGNRADKLRWHFLLGQLLARNHQEQDAIRHYRRVARSNVDYEMAFNASLNQLFLESDGPSDAERQIRTFQKMLRDDKNKEFRDQILHHLGETYDRHGRAEEAIAFFNRSLRTPSNNLHQKASTYLRLADYYFENRQFSAALAYYDSTAMRLPVDYPDAEPIRRKLAHSAELIAHLQKVERQDSLQYLANMDPIRREEVLDSLIADRYAKVQSDQAEQTKRLTRGRANAPNEIQLSPFDQVLPMENIQAYADNRFYFNNPDAVGMGMSAFRRKWGDRMDEDNWRWSSISGDVPGGLATGSIETDARPNRDEFRGVAGQREIDAPPSADPFPGHATDSVQFAATIHEHYMSQLPLDAESLTQSHLQIKAALSAVGEIYRYAMNDSLDAIGTYQNLLERYPADPDRSEWLYQLVQLTGPDTPASASYQQLLETDFPESIYNRILKDPSYLQRVANEKKHLNEIYEDVYNRYSEGEFHDVIQRVDRLLLGVDKNLPAPREHPEMYAQLAYLRVLALGRTEGAPEFESGLQQLIDQFPSDSLVTPLAKQHLDFMGQNPHLFAGRTYALEGETGAGGRRFLDEPGLTRWPQLVIRHAHPTPRDSQPSDTQTATPDAMHVESLPVPPASTGNNVALPRGGSSRDLSILPDQATYYFVINVMHPRVNLAPSRFGIGQFNRTRYGGQSISHQVKKIEETAQLLYVGPFDSYEHAKQYETRILPLLPTIMKIPADVYQTFLVTESVFGTLSDFEKVNDYQHFYREQ